MDQRARDFILSQGVRPDALCEISRGKPLAHRPQNFKLPLHERIKGYLGPPAFGVRARNVERTIATLHARLHEDYVHLRAKCGPDVARFATAWTRYVESLELGRINGLIAEHNTYYPMEANLRANPDGGGYLLGSTPWEPTPKVTAEGLLERFPPQVGPERSA